MEVRRDPTGDSVPGLEQAQGRVAAGNCSGHTVSVSVCELL